MTDEDQEQIQQEPPPTTISPTMPLDAEQAAWLKRFCWKRGVRAGDVPFVQEMCERLLPYFESANQPGGVDFAVASIDSFGRLRYVALLVLDGLNALESMESWITRRGRARLPNTSMLDDLVQEVKLRCSQDIVWYWQPIIARPADETSRKRRANVILRNLVIDLFRKRNMQDVSLNTPVGDRELTLGDILPASDKNLEGVIEDKWILARTDEFFEVLRHDPKRYGFTQKHARIVLLYFTQDITYEEIADQLQVSLGTISRVVKRARRILESQI